MTKLYIIPWNVHVKGTSFSLSKQLGATRILDKGIYAPEAGHTIINYGRGTFPAWYEYAIKCGVRVLNMPNYVGVATNKKKTFNALHKAGVPTVEFTTDKAVAESWLVDGHMVVGRMLLQASQGDGIEMFSGGDAEAKKDKWAQCKLYTKFVPKAREFRVHVVNGKVIDYVQKKRSNGYKENAEFVDSIRNHGNGWIFCHDNIVDRDDIRNAALAAVEALQLDFGAVDVLAKKDDVYVLEVNTAPGLKSPTTLSRYVEAFKEVIGNA